MLLTSVLTLSAITLYGAEGSTQDLHVDGSRHKYTHIVTKCTISNKISDIQLSAAPNVCDHQKGGSSVYFLFKP